LFIALKDYLNIQLSNLLIMSVADEGYSKTCRAHEIQYFLFFFWLLLLGDGVGMGLLLL